MPFDRGYAFSGLDYDDGDNDDDNDDDDGDNDNDTSGTAGWCSCVTVDGMARHRGS